MSRIPVRVRTARKTHHCDTHSRRHIQPGERYEIWTEQPRGEVFCADGWMVLKSCDQAALDSGRDLYAADTAQEPHRG